ncbi:MAG: STAS domain-containing protein [Jatrophihabitantaceae bacterium]
MSGKQAFVAPVQCAQPLEVRVDTGSGHPVVSGRGELDLATARELQDAVLGVHRAGAKRITLDLAGVGFCDWRGLAALLYASQLLAGAGGGLSIARPSPAVRRIVRLGGLSDTLLVPLSENGAM